MILEIKTFVSVGPISFGMKRKEVRQILKVEVESFLKNEDDETETDEFETLGIFVEYNKKDQCIAVEMSSPALPIFKSINLLSTPYAEVKAMIISADPNVDYDEDGIDSEHLGIGLSASNVGRRDKKSPAESVIAFQKDYYNLV